MKLTTTASELHETISLAAVVVPTQAQLPAYTGVLLEVSGATLTVRGNDGETSVAVQMPVTAAKPGKVLVSPVSLLKYLNTLPGDAAVELAAPSATSLEVTAADAAPYKFTAIAASFPAAATPRRDKVPANLAALSTAVDAVKDCAGVLPGGADKMVQLVSGPDGLRLHATDRFRVARSVLPADSGFGTFDGLLSLRVLALVATIAPTHVQLDAKGRDMAFHSDQAVISTRLIQSPFPVVDSVLNADLPFVATLHRTATLAALRRLAAVATPGGKLRVEVAGDQAHLSVSNATQGSGVETVTLDGSANGELLALVNFDFFRAALNTHTAARVALGWSEPLKPVFLTSTDPLPVTLAIMPMQD